MHQLKDACKVTVRSIFIQQLQHTSNYILLLTRICSRLSTSNSKRRALQASRRATWDRSLGAVILTSMETSTSVLQSRKKNLSLYLSKGRHLKICQCPSSFMNSPIKRAVVVGQRSKHERHALNSQTLNYFSDARLNEQVALPGQIRGCHLWIKPHSALLSIFSNWRNRSSSRQNYENPRSDMPTNVGSWGTCVLPRQVF